MSAQQLLKLRGDLKEESDPERLQVLVEEYKKLLKEIHDEGALDSPGRLSRFISFFSLGYLNFNRQSTIM